MNTLSFSKNNNEIASANNSETANKLAINDQKQLNDDKISKKEIEVELATDITKKDADQLKDTLFKSNSLTPQKPNEQVNNSKENQETDINPLPKNVIKPVKDKKMTNWTVGIVGLRGYLKGSALRGEYGGVGLSVTTNYKTKWRINSSLDYTTMEYEDDEDSEYHSKHPKPKVNPQDSFTRWTANGQPFSQISFGLDRIFTYKKMQTYLGIGTGVNIILPYTIRYEVRDVVSNHDNVYNTEVKKAKTTFSGLQFNVGIGYPIFKKVDFTFALQFQSNKIDEELNWQKQMGLRSGLRYRF